MGLPWLTILAGERRKAEGQAGKEVGSWIMLSAGMSGDFGHVSSNDVPIHESVSAAFDATLCADSLSLDDMLLVESTIGMGMPIPSTQQQRAEHALLPAAVPSPYKNHIALQSLSFYTARIQNALYMGLPLFLAQKDDDISPWYWHTQFATLVSRDLPLDAAPSSNSATFSYEFCVQRPVRRTPCFRMIENVMPDLVPTTLQRERPHGMYLDMIPFPVFRDRVITLLCMDPPAFDERDLKRDIEDEGLLVWGVSQGSTERTASLVRDRRNWECSKWFYRKWKLLIDGSGLDEQSRWWRMMRGEEDSDGDD